MRSSTLLLLRLPQHSKRCRRKPRRSSRQRRRARKRERNDGMDEAEQRDLSAGLPLECIVRRLPLRQRAQMMCVCKAWYVILRDCVAADVAELRKGPCLLMARYCRDTRSWKLVVHGKSGPPSPQVFCIPLRQENLCVSNGSFQGLLMGCTCTEIFPTFNDGCLLNAEWKGDFQRPRLASSGGLMCGLLSADPHHLQGDVVVFDCLTGSSKLLPRPLRSDLLFSHHSLYQSSPFPYPCPCSIHMAVDDLDPTHYYIMLTRVRDFCRSYFRRSERHMEVFDSKTGSWKDATFPLDRFKRFSVDHSLPSYVWDGDFFFIWEDDQLYRRDFIYIGAYNVARDAWSLRLVPHFLFSQRGTLHKFQGRLFFAFILENCLGFKVCEVKQTRSEEAAVVEVACTPRQVLREIEFRLKQDSNKFWLEQDSSFCSSGNEGELLAGGSCFCWFIWGRVHEVPPLIYDLTSNSWYFLREEEWFPGLYYGALLYQPNLYARV